MTLKKVHLDGDSLKVAVIQTTIDAIIEGYIAFEYIKDSRRKKIVAKNRRPLRRSKGKEEKMRIPNQRVATRPLGLLPRTTVRSDSRPSSRRVGAYRRRRAK